MISGSLSLDDYLAAQRLHQQPYIRRQLLILVALALAGLLIAWAGYVFPGIVIFGAGAGGLVGQLFTSKFTLPRRHRRIYQQQASLQSHYIYTWDPNGISVVSNTGQARRPWQDYVKSQENDRVFLLYHSDVMFEVLSKSWFQDPEQADELRQFASRIGT